MAVAVGRQSTRVPGEALGLISRRRRGGGSGAPSGPAVRGWGVPGSPGGGKRLREGRAGETREWVPGLACPPWAWARIWAWGCPGPSLGPGAPGGSLSLLFPEVRFGRGEGPVLAGARVTRPPTAPPRPGQTPGQAPGQTPSPQPGPPPDPWPDPQPPARRVGAPGADEHLQGRARQPCASGGAIQDPAPPPPPPRPAPAGFWGAGRPGLGPRELRGPRGWAGPGGPAPGRAPGAASAGVIDAGPVPGGPRGGGQFCRRPSPAASRSGRRPPEPTRAAAGAQRRGRTEPAQPRPPAGRAPGLRAPRPSGAAAGGLLSPGPGPPAPASGAPPRRRGPGPGPGPARDSPRCALLLRQPDCRPHSLAGGTRRRGRSRGRGDPDPAHWLVPWSPRARGCGEGPRARGRKAHRWADPRGAERGRACAPGGRRGHRGTLPRSGRRGEGREGEGRPCPGWPSRGASGRVG